MSSFNGVTALRFNFDHIGECELPFFEGVAGSKHPTVANAVVLAKNGTGKSSIARILSEAPSSVQAIRQEGSDSLSEDSRIFVFDEKFVTKHVISGGTESMQPVVLIGDQAANAEEIDKKLTKLHQYEGGLKNLKQKISDLSNKVGEYQKAIDVRLKDTSTKDSWKRRNKRLGLSKNLVAGERKKIYEANIEEFEASSAYLKFEELVETINSKEKAEKVSWSFPQVQKPASLDEIKGFLKQYPETRASIQTGGLLERIESLTLGRATLEDRIRSTFSGNADFCSECFQDIDGEYRQMVVKAIEHLLREMESDDFASQAEKLSLHELRMAPRIEVPGFANVLRALDGGVEKYNDLVREINTALKVKADNPARVTFNFRADFESVIESLNDAIVKVTNAVEAHNNEVENLAETRLKAEELNFRLSRNEISEAFSLLQKEEEKLRKKKDKRESTEKCIEDLDAEIDNLKAAQQGEAEAANRINSLLAVVFGTSSICLEPVSTGYVVKNRASTLAPAKLSTGERNILALCYFLVTIAKGERFEEAFLRDQLIVFDDPVSSFDADNKYGVHSLLMYAFRLLNARGSKAKTLLLTHDLNTATTVSRSLTAIASGNASNWQFSNTQLERENFENLDVYLEILSLMFENFSEWRGVETPVKKDEDCKSDTAGKLTSNQVRRVWEAFVHFEIGESATDASTQKKVRSYIISARPEMKTFLDRYPGRVFHHPDSHSKEQVNDFNFELSPSLSRDEFRRYIAETVCFMHLVAPFHLPARLGSDDETAEQIKAILDSAVDDLANGRSLALA